MSTSSYRPGQRVTYYHHPGRELHRKATLIPAVVVKVTAQRVRIKYQDPATGAEVERAVSTGVLAPA